MNNGDLISRSAFLKRMMRTARYFDIKFDIMEEPAVDAVVLPCKPGEYWRDWNGDRVRIETVTLLQNRGLYDIGTVTYSYEDDEDDFACNWIYFSEHFTREKTEG